MKRKMLGGILGAGLFLLASANTVSAQVAMPGQNNPVLRPPVSPYLNLARGGSPAINYYGLVRPQLDTARQIQALQSQQGYMPQFGVPVEDEGLLMETVSITGHSSAFFNFGHYFVPPGTPMRLGFSGQGGGFSGIQPGGPMGGIGGPGRIRGPLP